MPESDNFRRRRLMTMMEVLSHGRKLATQLQNLLDSSGPPESRDYLIGEILSVYSKALHLANSLPSDPSKKRKTLPRWVKKVKVESETEQGRLSDGYSWRKYGHKNIRGAAFPRGYYRCSYLHSQGCIATKQIQKSDHDPTLFNVTYSGRHTCTTRSLPTQIPPPVSAVPPSAVPVLETSAGEVAKDWFIPDASPETSGSNLIRPASSGNNVGALTPASEFKEQGTSSATNSSSPNWPQFTLEELGIDSNFSFDNPDFFQKNSFSSSSIF